MCLEVRKALHLEKRVQDTRVTEKDLGRLDLTLSDVLEPRGEHANHEGACQNVEVAARRILRGAKRPRELGRVPNLAVVVGDHCPEASKRLRRNRDSSLR